MPNDSVLVTGAAGFIGRLLSRELQRCGFSTRCAVRKLPPAGLPCADTVAVGEVSASTDWRRALAGTDTVFHLVARAHVLKETAADPAAEFNTVNRDGTRNLAEAAAAVGVRRLVYVSSIGVNGDCTPATGWFDENSVAMPHSVYAASKYAAELALEEIAARTGLEIVIVRPPLVYGPGNPGNFLRLLKLVDRGLPLPLAAVDNRRSLVYAGNLVDFLIAAAVRPEAAGQLYLVSDNEAISTPQLIRELARLMGRTARLWPFPVTGLRLAGKVLGRSAEIERLVGSLVVDNGKSRRQVHWKAPFTLSRGLEETVRWYREAMKHE